MAPARSPFSPACALAGSAPGATFWCVGAARRPDAVESHNSGFGRCGCRLLCRSKRLALRIRPPCGPRLCRPRISPRVEFEPPRRRTRRRQRASGALESSRAVRLFGERSRDCAPASVVGCDGGSRLITFERFSGPTRAHVDAGRTCAFGATGRARARDDIAGRVSWVGAGSRPQVEAERDGAGRRQR